MSEMIYGIHAVQALLERAPELVRQPLVFPETLQLLSALEQFRNARTHFAFVVDEFGSVEVNCSPNSRSIIRRQMGIMRINRMSVMRVA